MPASSAETCQCSFGFEIESERYIELGDGKCRWEIEKVNPLYEVSPCTFPAYEDTGIDARRRDLETINRRRLELWRAEMRRRLGGNNGT